MSNEVILNLSFDNQTVTDLTGNWTLDGTPNATYEQIEGRDGYSIVEGSLGRCIVLNAVDQNARYDEYTVDFDMFVKSTYTPNYYNYNVFYLWSQKNPKILGSFDGKIGEVLLISPRIGGSSPMGVTSYSPIGRWVHVTITSGPTGEDNLYHTAVYVDGVKLTERTDSMGISGGNPFGISQRIIPCARDPGSFLMPNGPGVCLNTYKIVAGIHIPDQNPAISLFNLSRVFNNFCTWLKRQLSTVAFTGSYNDLSNKPTISTVNDGTLTIQQNGTNVQTFTANASTNKTANIQCVDLSTAQTIGGVKTFASNMVIQGSKKVTCNLDSSFIELDGGTTWGKGGSIVLSGQDRSSYTNSVLIVSKSDTNTDIIQYQNGELKPLSNNTNNSSLGTSTNKWSKVYSDDVVHTTGNETIEGVKTFSTNGCIFWKQIKINHNLEYGTNNPPSYAAYHNLMFTDANGWWGSYIENVTDTNGNSTLAFYVRNTNDIQSRVYLKCDIDGSFSMYPISNNVWDLGTSTNKWKNVNTVLLNGKTPAYNDDVIPRSGGAVLTGSLLASSTIDEIGFGYGWGNGGTIYTYSPTHSTAEWQGTIRLEPLKTTNNFKTMQLAPDGTWTWNGTACQITSDQRLKQQINQIDDKLLDAWEDVNLVQFKYNDAVKEKSDNARLHTGYVVQQIDEACKSHGVDISQYGLYCHEEYPEETKEVEVEQEDGTKVKERKVIREASEHYSLRYTEVYAVECMYLRRCIARLTARIEELEKGNNSK